MWQMMSCAKLVPVYPMDCRCVAGGGVPSPILSAQAGSPSLPGLALFSVPLSPDVMGFLTSKTLVGRVARWAAMPGRQQGRVSRAASCTPYLPTGAGGGRPGLTRLQTWSDLATDPCPFGLTPSLSLCVRSLSSQEVVRGVGLRWASSVLGTGCGNNESHCPVASRTLPRPLPLPASPPFHSSASPSLGVPQGCLDVPPSPDRLVHPVIVFWDRPLWAASGPTGLNMTLCKVVLLNDRTDLNAMQGTWGESAPRPHCAPRNSDSSGEILY